MMTNLNLYSSIKPPPLPACSLLLNNTTTSYYYYSSSTYKLPLIRPPPYVSHFVRPIYARSTVKTTDDDVVVDNGSDLNHWLIVMDPPQTDITRDELIATYIKTLATVVGSEKDARMKIYSVSTRHYYAFGALISEKLSHKVATLKNVRWVLPDSYLDADTKDYGGLVHATFHVLSKEEFHKSKSSEQVK